MRIILKTNNLALARSALKTSSSRQSSANIVVKCLSTISLRTAWLSGDDCKHTMRYAQRSKRKRKTLGRGRVVGASRVGGDVAQPVQKSAALHFAGFAPVLNRAQRNTQVRADRFSVEPNVHILTGYC